MSYHVEWSRQAIRDMRRLDKPLVTRITNAVETFAETGHGDVKRLTNAGGVYRLRVGVCMVKKGESSGCETVPGVCMSVRGYFASDDGAGRGGRDV